MDGVVFGPKDRVESTKDGWLDGANDGALVGDDSVGYTVGLAEGDIVGWCDAGCVVGALEEGPADGRNVGRPKDGALDGNSVGWCDVGLVVGALEEGPTEGLNVGRPKEEVGALDAGDWVGASLHVLHVATHELRRAASSVGV